MVSVIIPTYNRSALLAEAIESVLGQTYPEIELLIADDGSTDDTPDCVAAFRHSRLRYLKLSHTGCQSVPRNRALDEATGSYVAFLDDDDIWMPEKLEYQIEGLHQAPAAEFSYTDARFLYPDGSTSPRVLRHRHKQRGPVFDPLLVECFIHPSTILVRRALVDRVGGFDETLHSVETYEWYLRLAYRAGAEFVDEPLVHVRRHSGQISGQREVVTYEEMVVLLRALHQRFDLTWKQRVLIRQARARAHTKLGLTYENVGNATRGRPHFRKAFWLNPFQRLWWRSVVSRNISRLP